MQKILNELEGWLPTKLLLRDNKIMCQWHYFTQQRPLHPFFEDSFAQNKQLPQNRNRPVVSSLSMLHEWSEKIETQKDPSVIIFHISRCGSTLLTQLLNADENNVTLSEPPFFDELLRATYKFDPEKNFSETLKAAVSLYQHSFCPRQEFLYLKTDSWHLHFYKQYREIFPNTLFLLLYRQPKEVLISQKKQRGIQSVPGLIEPAVFGWPGNSPLCYDLDVYMMEVLKSYYTRMIEICKNDNNFLLYNYNQGIIGLVKHLYALQARPLSDALNQSLCKRALYHAKSPLFAFEGDRPFAGFDPDVEDLMNLYNSVEEIRSGKQL